VTENEEKRIALRVPPELWKKWDDKRHKEEETFQGLGVRLFNEWFSGHATPLQKALSEAAVEILQKSRLSALPGIPENKKNPDEESGIPHASDKISQFDVDVAVTIPTQLLQAADAVTDAVKTLEAALQRLRAAAVQSEMEANSGGAGDKIPDSPEETSARSRKIDRTARGLAAAKPAAETNRKQTDRGLSGGAARS
jgi:hypothetical protein